MIEEQRKAKFGARVRPKFRPGMVRPKRYFPYDDDDEEEEEKDWVAGIRKFIKRIKYLDTEAVVEEVEKTRKKLDSFLVDIMDTLDDISALIKKRGIAYEGEPMREDDLLAEILRKASDSLEKKDLKGFYKNVFIFYEAVDTIAELIDTGKYKKNTIKVFKDAVKVVPLGERFEPEEKVGLPKRLTKVAPKEISPEEEL